MLKRNEFLFLIKYDNDGTHKPIFTMHQHVWWADRNNRLGIGLKFNRAWAWRNRERRGIRIIQHVEREAWRPAFNRDKYSYTSPSLPSPLPTQVDVLWVADGKYFLSPRAQSASILEGDKGPTVGNPVDRTEAIHCSFCEKNRLHPVPLERIGQNHRATATRSRSRIVDG